MEIECFTRTASSLWHQALPLQDIGFTCLHFFLGPVVADDACPTLFNHVDEALVEIHVILSGFKLFPPCVALATSHEDKFSVCSSLYSIA